MFLLEDEKLYPLSKSEKDILSKYNKLNEKQKEAIKIHINSYFDE